MSKWIPLSEPVLNGAEWQYLKECLDTGWISAKGKFLDKFEKNICDYTKSKYAVAVSSGTAALHIALQLVGTEPQDEVIVPTVSFIAPVNAIRYVNAHPIFIDCDSFYNIDIDKTIEFIEKETEFKKGFSFNKKTKRKIRAIIPVHVFGNACDLDRLMPICKKRNIKMIEDATESLGTVYKTGKHTGTFGEIGCLSFNGNKIVTAGGGGMIVTNDSKLASRAQYLTTQAKDDTLHYIHHAIGYNYRLSNLHAAVGLAQLEQLPIFLKKKKRNYDLYKNHIDKIEGLDIAETPQYAKNNYWMVALRIDKKVYRKNRQQIMKDFLREGIEVRPLWYLNHLQKPYQKFQAFKISQAYKLLESTLNLPSSMMLTEDQIFKIIRALKKWKK